MPTNGDRDHFPSRLRFSALEASRAVHDSRMTHYSRQISGNESLTWSNRVFQFGQGPAVGFVSPNPKQNTGTPHPAPPWPTQSVRVWVYHNHLQCLCMASKGTSWVEFHYATFFGLPDMVELLITSHSQDINSFWLPSKMRTTSLRARNSRVHQT